MASYTERNIGKCRYCGHTLFQHKIGPVDDSGTVTCHGHGNPSRTHAVEETQVDPTSTPDEAQTGPTTHTMSITPEALAALQKMNDEREDAERLEAQSHEHDSEPFDLMVHLDTDHPNLVFDGSMADALARHSDVHNLDEEESGPVVLERYEPIGPLGASETVTEEEVDALPADSKHVAETEPGSTAGKTQEARSLERPAKEASFWDTSPRPPFILSFVESDHPHGGFVIGWDTCGECRMHLRSCTCKDGPSQPNYVKRWRPAADKNHDKPKPLTPEQKKAVVAADPQVVEKAVDEALGGPTEGWTADGKKVRKQRSDAGQPRGPRKKAPATPDSVSEAAGDLSAAMTKEK